MKSFLQKHPLLSILGTSELNSIAENKHESCNCTPTKTIISILQRYKKI